MLGYFALLLRLRREKPDYVISSWTQDNILVALAFLFSGTKVVLVEHSPWSFHHAAIRFVRRLVYPFAFAVIVLNPRELDHYQRFLSNVRLIPNPVASPPARRRRREKLILCIGHLEPLKQFDQAIRAVAMSGLEDRGWSLAIVGSGSERERLQQLIDQLGLKRARIVPPGVNIGEWYGQATMLVVTSRLESFSLVVAEAMLSGVIPIAYASDGPSFLLEGFPAQLVKMDDVGALASRMTEVAGLPDADAYGRKLAEAAASRFAPEQVVEQWADLLS